MALSDPSLWSKLHVVHVGIPIDQFTRGNATEPHREEPGKEEPGKEEPCKEKPGGDESGREELRRDVPRILSIGRLVPDKGHAVLLEAAALLLERGHDFEVTLAGDGPSRAGLERLADSIGLASRTSFPGAVGQDDIHDLYAGASIFCMSSFAEGVPCVLMEAMSMELPVISTRIAGIPELIDDGQTGLLVAPGSAQELADALERLLLDPSRGREMGSRARQKVIDEFNTEITTEQLHELFAQMLMPTAKHITAASV